MSAPLLSVRGVTAFYGRVQALKGVAPVVAHNCYLVNLASTRPKLRDLSLKTTVDELKRCELLHIFSLIMHPGAALGQTEHEALKRLTETLDEAIEISETHDVRVLLETTAGQGTILGSRFEQLAEVIALSRFPKRIGVCYDTCHTFVAGYDIRTAEAYKATMREFGRIIGLGKLLCFHVNDALGDFGSHLDRHAHIGKGKIGESAFAHILTDTRFASVPKILETPKGTFRRQPWDKINLNTLRRLAGEAQADKGTA